jgi:hypothetical protein
MLGQPLQSWPATRVRSTPTIGVPSRPEITRNRSMSWGVEMLADDRRVRPGGRMHQGGLSVVVLVTAQHHGLLPGDLILISPGSAAPSPDEPGGGVAPAQPLPAAAPARHHHPRRALLGQCRPSSSPWPATAGPAPSPAARCRAPDTADRRSYRTAGREHGRPGNARRRSGECTAQCRRAWASTCSGGPCPAPNRARWRSPRAGASSGASRGLTALGPLPGSDQPTKQAGTARPERIAHSPYAPPVWTAGQSLRAAGDPKATAGASYTVADSISSCELHGKGRLSETDQTGRPRPMEWWN